MLGKIESIETKQKKQLDGIKFFLENGNIKNKLDPSRILLGGIVNPVLIPSKNGTQAAINGKSTLPVQ